MAAPTIANSKTSTATKYGGDALNNVNRFLNGVDVTSQIGTPIIRTPTKIPSDILKFTDPAEDNTVTVKIPSLSVDKNINLVPSNVVDNDEVLFKDTVQTVTGKVISAGTNTVTGLTNSNLSGSAAIADANLAQITDTTKLPSTTLFTTNTATVTNKTINPLNNVIPNIGTYKYTIFKSGSSYYCRNNISGSNVAFGTDPLPVLRYPLINGGSVYVQEADYTLPALTGGETVYLDFPVEPLYCQFYMDKNAWLIVPNGFANTVVRLKNSSSQHSTGHKLGVNIKEAGTAVQDWTGILIEAAGSTIKGVYDTNIEYGYIKFPGIGIKYNNDATCTSGFLTGNFCSNVTIWGPRTAGIDFGMDVTYTTSPNLNGIHRHRFRNILIQFITISGGSAGSSTTCVGVRDIRHVDMKFEGVYVADFPIATAKSATIHADATSPIIDGGTMTAINFEDNSTSQTTKIRDQYKHTQIGRITPGQGGVSIDILPTGTTNTTSWYNSGSTERFWIRKDGGTNEVYLDSIKQTGAGALRPIVVRMNDVNGSTVTESFRVDTGAKLQVNTDKLALLDSGGDHKYNIKTSNLAADRDITYPLLAANDVPVFQAHTQTLTNKTISGSSNTITNIGDSSLSANVPLLNAANTFTAANTLSNSAIYPLITYRNINTAAAEVGGISFNGDPSTGSNVSYAGLIASIISNTAGAESGQLKFQTKASGALATRMALNNAGVLFIGNSLRVALSETGQTSQHTFTFPDATTTLVGADTTQTLTNKTFNADGTGNSITNIEDADIKAAAGIAYSKLNLATSIVNADINGSAAIATTKLADSANFILKTLDNSFGAHYHDITKMTAPSAPAANNLRFYVDTTNTHLKAQNSLGTVYPITSLSGPVRGIKSGRWDGASATRGAGIFASDFSQVGAGATTIDATNGVYQIFTTGATTGNGSLLRYANLYTTRAFNPYLGVRFMIGTATNNRIHIGFRSVVSAAIADGTDDPLSGISGIMLAQRAADTNFQIATNNGTTTTFTDTGTAIAASTLYTIEFRADEANSKFQYSFNGGAWTDITATIPASGTALGMYSGIQTNENVAHALRIYAIETTSDK